MFYTVCNGGLHIKECLCLTVCNGGLHIKECVCLTQFVMVDYT